MGSKQKDPKDTNAKFCVPVECKIASLDSFVNEAFLQCECIIKWDKCGCSRFTHYTTHVAPNDKTIFFTERGNRTHRYVLESIPLSAIWTIAFMRFSSHALRCDTGCWGTRDESGRLCTLCPKKVREFEYHTLIQCSAFDHIRPSFPHIFDQTQSLHEFLSQP